MILMLMVAFAFANSSIGVNYSQVAGEIGFGMQGDTEFNLSQNLHAELSGNLQNAGNLYQGKVVTEVGVPISTFDVALAAETLLIGSELDALGRDTSLGVKATANLGNVGVVVGVFGANAGEWGSPSAQDILIDQHNFDIRQLEGKGLDTLKAPSNHLSIKDGNRVNLRIGLETSLWDDKIEAKLSARPELGSDENRVHQLIGSLQTGFSIGGGFRVLVQGEVAAQTWKDGYETQTVLNTSFNRTW